MIDTMEENQGKTIRNDQSTPAAPKTDQNSTKRLQLLSKRGDKIKQKKTLSSRDSKAVKKKE